MLGNRKIAGHFLFYELTNLEGFFGIYNVSNLFTILLFILIISSFYHQQAYILEVLVTPALRVTGFSLFVFLFIIY